MVGIVFAILGVAGLVLVLGILAKISQVFRSVSPFLDAVKGTDFDAIEAEYETTPKSVNGMTSLCIPRIMEDFPEFDWHDFRQRAENMLRSAFRAISEENLSLVVNASGELKNQISLIIDANKDAGLREIYSDVKIHQTEIKDYRKRGGSCVITLQSAVGYIHYKTKAGGVVEGSDTAMCQKRYDIELLYVQDTTQVADGQKALGSTCPQCGAPIKNLGSKACPYCGCGLTELNIRVWSINRFSES